MQHTNPQATARSQFLQLVALTFSHPTPELVDYLRDTNFSLLLAQAALEGFGCQVEYLPPTGRVEEIETDYIDLFQLGKGGTPRVSLNAGEYREFSDNHSRPELLLRYSDWYQHFGLEVDDSEGANELPDHLICQLEFVSWLNHLESQAESGELHSGYQLAQLDFSEQQLTPFLNLLAGALQKEDAQSSYSLIAIELQKCMDSRQQALLENPPRTHDPADNQVALVNLWE